MVVVTTPLGDDVVARLEPFGPIRVWNDADRPMPSAILAAWLPGADALVCTLNDRIGAETLRAADRLRVVANVAVGYDNLDLTELTRRGIAATNTPDVLTEATAELTWALILALCRGIVPAREALLAGRWTHWRFDGFLGTELAGKVLGIVGLGRIGQAVARRADAFSVRVIGVDPGPRHRARVPFPVLPRDRALALADIVSLHVPLTDETRNMVDQEWLRRMKPHSFLVNTSRGGVVVEEALLDALDRGQLAGAALDVFQREPIDGSSPLARHPRVLVTPHIGSATVETRRAMAQRAVDNVVAALSGIRPRDLLNPTVWSSGRGGISGAGHEQA